MQKRKSVLIAVLLAILLTGLIIWLIFRGRSAETVEPAIVAQPDTVRLFDIPIAGWTIFHDTIRSGDFLGTILMKYGIGAAKIDRLSSMSTDSFNVTMVRVGRPYTVFSDTVVDSVPVAKIFVYESGQVNYTLYDFRDSDTIRIERRAKVVDTLTSAASGEIRSSLWQTMIDNGYSWQLALELSKSFAWTVDFYYLQPGDWFKVIYDRYLVDGKDVGLGNIRAGVFCQSGKELWMLPFKQDSTVSFFDTLGNSVRRTFLPAPLEYTHISSRYTTARMHPIFHKVKAHLAVDFSAPAGTPVYAAADGVIVFRGTGRGAGNYVKIKHNSIYATVYMHFSRFGVFNVGDRVNQGDIIGYVGSTGWSTGPHLHYEIHENGRKIDPLKFSPPPAEPIDSCNMARFNHEKRFWIDKLNGIKVKK